jgi:cobalt-zinc-cadmium efflux system membrane fusion protein
MIRQAMISRNNSFAVRSARGIIFAACSLILLASFACKKHEEASKPAEPIALKTAVARMTAIDDVLEIPARIAADPGRVVRVFPPAGGRLLRVEVRPGDQVERGRPVAILESSDIWQARSDFDKARAEDDKLGRTFKRTKLLFEHKVISEREFEDAQANSLEASSELDRAGARLRLLGASPDNNSNQVSLRAPISGTVLGIGAATGEISKSTDNSEAICTIADLSTIWIIGDIYEKDLASVQPGSSVEITVSAYPGDTWTGKVDQVSAAVDPATRTLKLRIVMPNPGRKFKPDMFGSIRVRRHQTQAMLIPSAAVLHEGGDTAVMVQTAAGKYERRLIQERPLNDRETVVLDGLRPGEQVVTEGAALLRGGGEN